MTIKSPKEKMKKAGGSTARSMSRSNKSSPQILSSNNENDGEMMIERIDYSLKFIVEYSSHFIAMAVM